MERLTTEAIKFFPGEKSDLTAVELDQLIRSIPVYLRRQLLCHCIEEYPGKKIRWCDIRDLFALAAFHERDNLRYQ
jgi:hypothetical protein